MKNEFLFRRFASATICLVVYFVVCFGIHTLLYKPTLEMSAYRAVVSSLPGRFHEPISQYERDHLLSTLEQLNFGGDLSALGLMDDEPSLTRFLGDDKFDMAATIDLLKDGRLRPARAKLELLTTKVDRIYSKRLRVLRYVFYLALAGGILILLYLMWLLFRVRSHVSQEISPSTELASDDHSNAAQLFSTRLSSLVAEEVKFGKNRAAVSCVGFDELVIPEKLNDLIERVAEQLVRNSVIHGGRPADQRILAGKPDHVSIRVSLQDRADDYLLTVWDNGEGIDAKEVIMRALELGLISQATANQLPIAQASKLIFLPNFTTRTNVKSVADDDIGLDVLHNLIKEYKGVFSIQNQLGISCQFSVSFPKP